ncbi:CU044_2847 family protein [Micromonospora wenchangensis]|uniref:CU044_2847 family protein n=1 Tax=Micromonospora wenchangensis TaxID=1185415 RepID=UPI00344A2F99
MGEIRVQVVPTDAASGDLRAGGITENLMHRVDELGDSILEVARGLQDRISREKETKGAAFNLAEVSLAFSLDLEAEAGVVVSRASTKAGFEVTLTWSRNS